YVERGRAIARSNFFEFFGLIQQALLIATAEGKVRDCINFYSRSHFCRSVAVAHLLPNQSETIRFNLN
ncbi:hypothetical protein QUA23_21215, partial [Microcoleus sp. Pol1C5]